MASESGSEDEGFIAEERAQMDTPKRHSPALEELIATLRTRLPSLQTHYGVRNLGIFGSYVRGEQRPHSDLDILVEFDDRPLTLLQFIALENELSDLLGIPVDLVERDVLKPAIGRYVLQEVVAV